MSVVVDLRIESEDWTREVPDLGRVCQLALDAGLAVQGGKAASAVDVLLTDDAEMQILNAKWRAKDKPTDVLSFPTEGGPDGFLGDIALGFGVAARDAAAGNKTLTAHLSHLLIHGLLHLLGHDHIDDDEAEIMETLERASLAKLGYKDPYSQTAPNQARF